MIRFKCPNKIFIKIPCLNYVQCIIKISYILAKKQNETRFLKGSILKKYFMEMSDAFVNNFRNMIEIIAVIMKYDNAATLKE